MQISSITKCHLLLLSSGASGREQRGATEGEQEKEEQGGPDPQVPGAAAGHPAEGARQGAGARHGDGDHLGAR